MHSKSLKEGTVVPSFVTMAEEFKNRVNDLLEAFLQKRPDLFLIDFTISSDHSIKVVLDGDNGVSVNDCIEASRALEHQLDREVHDFSLEVFSAGATAPLQLPRQYKQHIGRVLKVETAGAKYKGVLTEVNDQMIGLSWKERQPKPVGKGKVTVECSQQINFNEITKAQIEITFKP